LNIRLAWAEAANKRPDPTREKKLKSLFNHRKPGRAKTVCGGMKESRPSYGGANLLTKPKERGKSCLLLKRGVQRRRKKKVGNRMIKGKKGFAVRGPVFEGKKTPNEPNVP